MDLNKELWIDVVRNECNNDSCFIEDNCGRTFLMRAFEYCSKNKNCDSSVLLKFLDTNCQPEHVNAWGYTNLIYAFIYGGTIPNLEPTIFLKLLDMNCVPEQITECDNNTALMCAFVFYGKNPNCDSRVLLKLLNMNCNPNQVNNDGHTALTYALKYYGSNPNYDLNVFLKLIDLSQPRIERFKLIELLDTNTNDQNLKKNIMKAYLYNRRQTIINSRISKRVLKGKYDSLSIFD
jgi:hypothetical protein